MRLDIDNPCWFYKSADPVLLCTVQSMDYAILWRRDWSLIAYSGKPIGDEILWCNMSTRITRNATMRQERLQLSSSEMVDVVIEQGSRFVCENQGYQTPPITLYIPGKWYITQILASIANEKYLCRLMVFQYSYCIYP